MSDTNNIIGRGNACSGLSAQSRVEVAGSIVKKGLITDCSVANAGAIGEQGLITVSRIGSAGVIDRTSTTARQIQFALKLTF